MVTKGLPTLHIVGDNIPQAYYRAIKAVWENGLPMRTQYDRRNDTGEFIDPPSRDASVLIEVKDPLASPRYPVLCHCEIGAYIAEIFGVKDHLVVPMSVLRRMVNGADLSDEEKRISNHWPYTYHQRIVDHPEAMNGDNFDQLTVAIDAVVKTFYTRRAMMTTAVPNLDPLLPEDIPCLREIQLRCVEGEDGILYLNPTLMWRSRDLFKAWGDNVCALTCFLQFITIELGRQMGRKVKLGSYKDFSCSLHIYGQDFEKIQGDADRGLAKFFDTFPDEESFVARSLDSESAAFMLIIPQLEELKISGTKEPLNFKQSQIELIDWLIESFQNGSLV